MTDATAAVQTLAALLRQENEALTAMDFARAGALLAAKHAAADALAATRHLPAAPAAALHTLAELAEENRRLLSHALRVQRRVLDIVAKAARPGLPPARYGEGGRPAGRTDGPRRLSARL